MDECTNCGGSPRGICPVCGRTSLPGLPDLPAGVLEALGTAGVDALNAGLNRKKKKGKLVKDEVEWAARMVEREDWSPSGGSPFSLPRVEEIVLEIGKIVCRPDGTLDLAGWLEAAEFITGNLVPQLVAEPRLVGLLAAQGKQFADQVAASGGGDLTCLMTACYLLRRTRMAALELERQQRER